MLTENDVIDAVCSMLKVQGYDIKQILKGNKPGDDIVAIKHGNTTRHLFIEAKGETSGAKNSKNCGKLFESADIWIYTAEALYKAAEVLSREIGNHKMLAGVALPNNKTYRSAIKNGSLGFVVCKY